MNKNDKQTSKPELIERFQVGILHDWVKTLTALGLLLVPMFIILDFVTAPIELMSKFIAYRGISTAVILIQYIIIRKTQPSKLSILHGYIISITLGFSISMMTVDLGGFNSPYYAGLILVVIGVNLLLPWGMGHSSLNGAIILFIYITLNLGSPATFNYVNLINNLFFLISTIIISVSINHVHTKLINDQFSLRIDLREARDALWGEMQIARKIQEALLPENKKVKGFSITGFMKTADEVGGDYYDIISTDFDEHWVNMGDVSGHGVESGLITMMAQTSIRSILNTKSGYTPSDLLVKMNRIIKHNIDLLKVDRYLTLVSIKLLEDKIQYAGMHLDMIIYRKSSKTLEIVETEGTWVGLVDDIETHLINKEIPFMKGDILLLYTDGVTEAMNKEGELFGEDRLQQIFLLNIKLKSSRLIEKIITDIESFQETQMDDIALLIIKKEK